MQWQWDSLGAEIFIYKKHITKTSYTWLNGIVGTLFALDHGTAFRVIRVGFLSAVHRVDTDIGFRWTTPWPAHPGAQETVTDRVTGLVDGHAFVIMSAVVFAATLWSCKWISKDGEWGRIIINVKKCRLMMVNLWEFEVITTIKIFEKST